MFAAGIHERQSLPQKCAVGVYKMHLLLIHGAVFILSVPFVGSSSCFDFVVCANGYDTITSIWLSGPRERCRSHITKKQMGCIPARLLKMTPNVAQHLSVHSYHLGQVCVCVWSRENGGKKCFKENCQIMHFNHLNYSTFYFKCIYKIFNARHLFSLYLLLATNTAIMGHL